jgi:hypothetical protein
MREKKVYNLNMNSLPTAIADKPLFSFKPTDQLASALSKLTIESKPGPNNSGKDFD